MSEIRQKTRYLIESGKPAEALKILTSALYENETSDLWNDWACAAFACGDAALAESGLRRALELDSSCQRAAINLASMLREQGRHEESIPFLLMVARGGTKQESASAANEWGFAEHILPSLYCGETTPNREASARAATHAQVLIVQPAGYIHSDAFAELGETLCLGLKEVGLDARLARNRFETDAVNIVLGWHLLTEKQEQELPPQCVLYNLEQMDETNHVLLTRLTRLAERCEIWDYSIRNIRILHESGFPVAIHHAPIGAMAELSRIEPAAQQDIDVLFYGSVNERRARIIDGFKSVGLRVETAFGVYGDARDALIARAKVVLCVHYYETSIFEMVRASYLWMNRKAVVAECHESTEIDDELRGAGCFVPYDENACQKLVADDPTRRALEQRAFEIMSARDEGEILRRVLEGEAEVSPPLQKIVRKSRCALEASVIIPVWNKVEFTRRCIEKLRDSTSDESYEIVFIDNASTDETAELLATVTGETVITNSENRGFLEASNQGAAAARGRYLVFLNNDTEPQPGWLKALLQMAEKDASIGAVGAKLVYPDGRLQEAGGMIFQDASGWNFGRFGDPSAAARNRPCEVDYCSGAALLVRRDVFEKLGGFDSRYAPAYYEDVDLCFGIRGLGLKVMYCPSATVIHTEGITGGTDLDSGYKRYQRINREKFAAKWARTLAEQDPSPAITGREPVTADRKRLAGRTKTIRKAVSTTGNSSSPMSGTHILIVDPLLPLYDVAAGSLRLFRIVEFLRVLGCHVTYIARNGHKQEKYRKALEDLGVSVYATDPEKMAHLGYATDAPWIDLARVLSEPPCQIAWLSFYYLAEQYLPDIRRISPSTVIIVDSVDVHFLREARQAEFEQDRRAAREKAKATRRREMAIYGQADLVVAVTQADADVLRREGLNVPIDLIPTIHSTVETTPGWEARQGLVFVGNMNHPPNVDAVLWFCREILPRIRASILDVKLTVIGPNSPAEVQALASASIAILGWVPETEPFLDLARVSVAPLRVGAGMKGKIGEALARGVPVVTTSIGAEGMELRNGEHALVADEPESFAEAVVRLYRDRMLWERIARDGRELVESRYGVKAVRDKLYALLRKTMAGGSRRGSEGALLRSGNASAR